MDMTVDSIAFTQSARARTRFINLKTKKKVKEFTVKRRGYKRPDFNRMILDLCNHYGWTHEKIAFVLPVANASTVSEWARGGVIVARLKPLWTLIKGHIPWQYLNKRHISNIARMGSVKSFLYRFSVYLKTHLLFRLMVLKRYRSFGILIAVKSFLSLHH